MKNYILTIAFLTLTTLYCNAQANQSLSNLNLSTAVNSSLIPGITNTYDLGSATKAWKNIYLNGSIYIGGTQQVKSSIFNGGIFIGTTFSGTGTANTITGINAFGNNHTGSGNSVYGNYAMVLSNTGSYNNAFGSFALLYNNGNNNIAVGNNAMYNNNSGYSNVAIGKDALFNNKGGNNLIAIGDSALFNQNDNPACELCIYYLNTAVGSKALFKNTRGDRNTAIGYNTLYSNTSGENNTANGFNALYSNTTGLSNTANGAYTLYYNTTGSANTANGELALYHNKTGGSNMADGTQALYSNTTGGLNTAIGQLALYSNTTGSYNTAVGYNALQKDTTQSKNTAVGYSAGNNFVSTASTYLGHGAAPTVAGIDNSTALGFLASVSASNQVRLGNSSVKSIGGYVGFSNISDGRYKKNMKENVPGLAFINKLRPLTYTLDIDGIENKLASANATTKNDTQITEQERAARNDKSKIVYTGFVAQEVEETARKMQYDFSGVDAPKNDKDLYGLRYAEFVVPLVKAVQELSKMNDEKDATIASLTERLTKIEKAIGISSIPGQPVLSGNFETGRLEQNTPNPFKQATCIKFYLSSNTKQSQILITDMNGKTVKQQIINTNGNGQIILNGGELSPGTYAYSLYSNGKLMDSKKMIVIK